MRVSILWIRKRKEKWCRTLRGISTSFGKPASSMNTVDLAPLSWGPCCWNTPWRSIAEEYIDATSKLVDCSLHWYVNSRQRREEKNQATSKIRISEWVYVVEVPVQRFRRLFSLHVFHCNGETQCFCTSSRTNNKNWNLDLCKNVTLKISKGKDYYEKHNGHCHMKKLHFKNEWLWKTRNK